MEGLKELDEVSYVRFASVYKQFENLEEFITEVKSIKKRGVNTDTKGKTDE